MKHQVATLFLCAATVAAQAQQQAPQEQVSTLASPAETAAHPPEGVTTEQHPLKLAFIARAGATPAQFRPSRNMPEIVHEDLIRGATEPGKAPGKASQLIGYMPKLKVLPCEKGCEGKDYERAVAEFIKGYRGDARHFQERGEMIVQVRWFHVRPFYMRSLPYSADVFGVSFILEGKLVSLGRDSGAGISVKAHQLAHEIGGRLAVELAFTLGMGVQPSYVAPRTRLEGSFAGKVLATTQAIDGVLGVDDVRPRIEPATQAHAALLPAIDGIHPGEIAPITETAYIKSLMF